MHTLHSFQMALRQEVETLQKLVDHHPDVTTYQLKNEGLKAELELALKQTSYAANVTMQKARELESSYRQLQAATGKQVCVTHNYYHYTVSTDWCNSFLVFGISQESCAQYFSVECLVRCIVR